MTEPVSPDTAHLEGEARATIEAYRAYLDSPAFQHSIDLAVLVKIAGDENADIRERRRAAEVLAKLRLQAMDALAELTGTREQSLDRLGLKVGPHTLALTQVNQQIEIVRANNWRGAAPIEQGVEVEAKVLPAHAANGHDTLEGDDADCPSS